MRKKTTGIEDLVGVAGKRAGREALEQGAIYIAKRATSKAVSKGATVLAKGAANPAFIVDGRLARSDRDPTRDHRTRSGTAPEGEA